jgi:ERCC4-related helicase
MVQRVGRLIRFQKDKVGQIYILYVENSQEEKWLKNSIQNLKNVVWH